MADKESTLYLSGKMTGLPQYNFPAFMEAAEVLRSKGWTVLNPAEHDLEIGFDPSWSEVPGDMLDEMKRWDVQAIVRSDAVVVIPEGWETSDGVAAELGLADWLKRPVAAYDAAAATGLGVLDRGKAAAVPGFDVGAVTAERQSRYGHPYDHFNLAESMYNLWLDGLEGSGALRDRPDIRRCLVHIMHMVFDKAARLANDPLHLDSMDDIQGYASLFRQCLDRSGGHGPRG